MVGTRNTVPARYCSISLAKRPGVNWPRVTTVGCAPTALASIHCPALVPIGKPWARCREWANGRRRPPQP